MSFHKIVFRAPPVPRQLAIEQVLDVKIEHGEIKFLIKYQGRNEASNSYESLENLAGSLNLVSRFLAERFGTCLHP